MIAGDHMQDRYITKWDDIPLPEVPGHAWVRFADDPAVVTLNRKRNLIAGWITTRRSNETFIAHVANTNVTTEHDSMEEAVQVLAMYITLGVT